MFKKDWCAKIGQEGGPLREVCGDFGNTLKVVRIEMWSVKTKF